MCGLSTINRIENPVNLIIDEPNALMVALQEDCKNFILCFFVLWTTSQPRLITTCMSQVLGSRCSAPFRWLECPHGSTLSEIESCTCWTGMHSFNHALFLLYFHFTVLHRTLDVCMLESSMTNIFGCRIPWSDGVGLKCRFIIYTNAVVDHL